LGALAVAIVGLVTLVAFPGSIMRRATGIESGDRLLDLSPVEWLGERDAAAERPVYRYSVIPGGAYSATELAEAIRRDPVVAREYGGLANRPLRAVTVTAPRMAYVSYRLDDRVYWTKHKVRIQADEQTLTDGVTEIRARCGNCISLQPLQPTSEEEPDLAELDRLEPDDDEPTAAPALPPVATSTLEAPVVTPFVPFTIGAPLLGSGDAGSPSPGSLGTTPWSGVPVAGLTDPLTTRRVPSSPREDTQAPEGTPPGTGVPPIPPPGLPPLGPPNGETPPGPGGPPTSTPPGETPPGGTPPNQELPPGGSTPPSDGGGPHTIPEPATMLLFGGGAAAWLLRRGRRR
jgi:hypothetical protein